MELKFVITIVVVAVAFAGFVVAALCYVYVCRRICKKNRKKSVAGGSSKLSNGYPKMPLFKAAARDIQVVQIMQKDQYSRYAELNKSPQNMIPTNETERKHSVENILTEGKARRKDGYKKLDRAKSQQIFFFDKSQSPNNTSSDEAINCTENFYPQAESIKPLPVRSISTVAPLERRDRRPKFIAKRSRRSLSTADPPVDTSLLIKGRYKSESDIAMSSCIEIDKESNTSSSSQKSTALSVVYPADGQVEFGLFFNSDSKSLDITINKLVDVSVQPINFMGILETVRHDSQDKPKSKVYVKEHEDQSLELILNGRMGYLIYVTLIPETPFKRHTSVVYGSMNIIFNELFSLTGYSLEELNQLVLCIHVLTQFGSDGEPIVIGEVKVPLQRLQACQSIPFLTHMTAPDCELELAENPLKEETLGELQVVISYNPMIHQLVVKVVQATGIPKISMTGNPNVSVKTSLYYCGSRMNKQSTSIHKRQKEPVFNETFQFDISKDRISECDLLFEVRHHGPMHRTVIGYVNVGKSAGGTGANHWRQLLDFSHFEKVHRIVPNKPAGLV